MKKALFAFFLLSFPMAAGAAETTPPAEWEATSTEVTEWSEAARDQYSEGRFSDLNRTLDKVRTRVDEVIQKAEGETKKEFEALNGDFKELNKLSGRKTRQGMRRIEKFFSRLHNAIARKKMLEASKAWGDKQTERAKALMADIHAHVKQAAQQADRKVSASTKEVLHNLKEITARLEKGGKKLGAEVGRVFSQLTRETERIQKQTN